MLHSFQSYTDAIKKKLYSHKYFPNTFHFSFLINPLYIFKITHTYMIFLRRKSLR